MPRLLIFSGFILIIVGIFLHFGLLKWAGNLPGDIRIERENFKFYFPLASCIVLSVIVTLTLRLLQGFSK